MIEKEEQSQAVFHHVGIEISGLCNAKCPWCPTGSTPMSERVNKFMPPELFRQIVARMSEENLKSRQGDALNVFNWGEPTLHPDFPVFFEIAKEYGYKVGISTNASKYVALPDSALENMGKMIFSVSGMTQANYGRIHGFEIASVLENIRAWCRDLDRVGVQDRTMSFHVYQFNHDDIDEARLFCLENGIYFYPFYAVLGNHERNMAYIEHRLSDDMARRVSEELELSYVPDLMAKSPAGYRCPQFDVLMIDEEGQALTCCGLARDNQDYSLGYFLDMPLKDILELKVSRLFCKKCISMGLAYWGNNMERCTLSSLPYMDDLTYI